jgi:hypothetical protein
VTLTEEEEPHERAVSQFSSKRIEDEVRPDALGPHAGEREREREKQGLESIYKYA